MCVFGCAGNGAGEEGRESVVDDRKSFYLNKTGGCEPTLATFGIPKQGCGQFSTEEILNVGRRRPDQDQGTVPSHFAAVEITGTFRRFPIPIRVRVTKINVFEDAVQSICWAGLHVTRTWCMRRRADWKLPETTLCSTRIKPAASAAHTRGIADGADCEIRISKNLWRRARRMWSAVEQWRNFLRCAAGRSIRKVDDAASGFDHDRYSKMRGSILDRRIIRRSL